MGPHLSGAVVMVQMRRQGRTRPSSDMACMGATLGLVDSLMDGCRVVLMVTLYDKSRIMWYPRLLCGIAVMGDILRVGGGLCFMLPQVTRQAYPCLTFLSVSVQSCMVGSGCKANGCAPHAIAALIMSIVQCVSMAASQPLVTKSMSMGAAGCSSAGPHGKTRPIKFLLYFLCLR